MNFKRSSNLLEKSDKFSKIPFWFDLPKSEFSCVHLYVRFWVTKQVPKGLVWIKKRVWIWNSNLTMFIIQTKLARISFKIPKYIVSYCLNTVDATVALGCHSTWEISRVSTLCFLRCLTRGWLERAHGRHHASGPGSYAVLHNTALWLTYGP
jgi:hypothetical protein